MIIRAVIACLILITGVQGTSRGQPAATSSADDQAGVEVTVYNNNLGLIKDARLVNLPRGKGELRFMDVPARIMPATVHVKALDGGGAFTVLEQNYEYDLLNSQKLLDKYVGKKIKLIDWNKFQDRKETVDAVLLSNNQGQIYKINDEIYLGHPGVQVLPQLPENLIAKPTLTWLYDYAGEKPVSLEVSYLTGNLDWKADYVVALNQQDTAADISGWITINNRSGATYKDARLKLVAGDVHRAQPATADALTPDDAASRAPEAPPVEERAFFEYHIYDLKTKSTIKDNQTKQIRLLDAGVSSVKKELLIQGVRDYFVAHSPERIKKQPVGVFVKFKNSKENNLGMPLPGGTMRLYKTDHDGSRQFVGEDAIKHTPKDEEVELKVGEAFDVVAERAQTDYKQLTRKLHESEWEIKIRNHKDEEVAVGIIEPVFANWEMISRSHPYKKVDAFTMRFDVSVPKHGEATVKYRVKVGL
jgi:hypothetical protein